MPALRVMQADFQSFLLREAAGMDSHVVGTARVPVATRLAIYRDAYRLRLIEALQANYPALAKLLDDEFNSLGDAYVRAHESTFRSIRYYGAELASFLTEHPEYSQAPVLVELARWEWTMTEVFDAADAEPIGVVALAGVQPERWADLRFAFHASVRRLSLHWNAPQIWKALTEDVERPQAAVQPDPTPWVLWRQNLQTYFRSLSPADAEALDSARAGACFGDICAALTQHFPEDSAPAHAAACLRQWIESGMVIAVT